MDIHVTPRTKKKKSAFNLWIPGIHYRYCEDDQNQVQWRFTSDIFYLLALSGSSICGKAFTLFSPDMTDDCLLILANSKSKRYKCEWKPLLCLKCKASFLIFYITIGKNH